MAFPAGVITKTLVVEPNSNTNYSQSRSSVEVVVELIMPPGYDDQITWQPTGDILLSYLRVIRVPPGTAAMVPLPVVDQDGWIDQRLTPVKMWHYKINVRYLIDGRKIGLRSEKYIMPMTADADFISYDDLQTDEPAPLYAGPTGLQGPVGPQGPPGYVTTYGELPVGKEPPPNPQYGSLWVPI